MVEIPVGKHNAGDGEWRGPRGHRTGAPSICARTSGEQLSRNQSSPSPVTATDSWLRGRNVGSPRRTPAQLTQPQFHCGKPPPRPNRARARTPRISSAAPDRDPTSCGDRGANRLAIVIEVGLIPADLGAHVDLDEGRGLHFMAIPFEKFGCAAAW